MCLGQLELRSKITPGTGLIVVIQAAVRVGTPCFTESVDRTDVDIMPCVFASENLSALQGETQAKLRLLLDLCRRTCIRSSQPSTLAVSGDVVLQLLQTVRRILEDTKWRCDDGREQDFLS